MCPRQPDDAYNDTQFDQLGIRDCAPLSTGMPRHWLRHSVRVSVGLIFTGNNCVSGEFFESFAVTSVDEAIDRLIANEDLNLQYTFTAESVLPLCAFDADWP